ncbi:trimethylamine methyltransferase family protein [uncultured Ruegeria sp.]|uniref:trimethylamine methyltransferase family protein n=1 Tax=uncultured Ruegeria sp. TaxID=259304 RepID=UPI002603FC00|nr:trimethylamine methyltransferase family protein [uncultured Ruegeria sp.]
MARRTGRRASQSNTLVQPPYRQLANNFAPVEVLSPEQVERIHASALDVLEDVGLRVMDAEARSLLREGGFKVDEATEQVFFDAERVMELVKLAPDVASVRGKDPQKRLKMGGGHLAISAVGGAPFVSDLQRGRRAGSHADLCDLMRLTQMLNALHMEGGCSVEPCDLPQDSRHLDVYLAACTLTDKPWKPQTVGAARARDSLEMAKILHQENNDQLAADPVFMTTTNTNTPLVLDAEIAQGVLTLARAGQVICVTPFALSGAMAPVTVAGALVLQTAENLASCALVQLARPGCPYIYGSFISNVDMKSGSPAFGTPEYTLGAQASGQIARFYGLPFRSSNVTASNAPDAQAAYESQMSLWGAITGHASVINQGAGWLEGGLVASFEKLIIDVEMLQMMGAWMEGLVVDDVAIGMDAIRDVGPGGHFFGTAHTLERYRDAFYTPLVSDWSNFENWTEAGAKDTSVRAHELCQTLLKTYEKPALDPAIGEELEAYVAKRKEEISRNGL